VAAGLFIGSDGEVVYTEPGVLDVDGLTGDVVWNAEAVAAGSATFPRGRIVIVRAVQIRPPVKGRTVSIGGVWQDADVPILPGGELAPDRRPIVIRLERIPGPRGRVTQQARAARFFADDVTPVAPFRRPVVVREVRISPPHRATIIQSRPVWLLADVPVAPFRRPTVIRTRRIPGPIGHVVYTNRQRWFADVPPPLSVFRRPVVIRDIRIPGPKGRTIQQSRAARRYVDDPFTHRRRRGYTRIARIPFRPLHFYIHRPPPRRFQTAAGWCTGHPSGLETFGTAGTAVRCTGHPAIRSTNGRAAAVRATGHIVTRPTSGSIR
jgi:hypothetical protein